MKESFLLVIFLSVFVHSSLPFCFSSTLLHRKIKHDSNRIRENELFPRRHQLKKFETPSRLFMAADERQLAKEVVTKFADAIDTTTWYGKIFKFLVIGFSSDSLSRYADEIRIAFIVFNLALCFFIGSYVASRQEKYEMDRFQQEVERDKGCRENMYFEAAEEILSKLSDPKIKPNLRKELEKQLLIIDPDRKIKLFLEKKSPRPVVKESSSSWSDFKAQSTVIPVNLFQIIAGWINIVFKRPANTTSSVSTRVTDLGADIETTLQLLDNTLTNVIDSAGRKNLKMYLMNRLNRIDHEVKRQSALTKIKRKLDDLNYWVELSRRI